MPTALNGGRQAQTPSVPTPPTPDLLANAISAASKRPQAVYKEATRPSKSEASTFYGLNYFHNRLKALGLTKENALDYGLDVDEQGNILQLVRRFDGSFIEFLPKQFHKKVSRILNHRSSYQPHLDMYYRRLSVTRHHPDYLKANPGKHKYQNQYGEKVRPLPAPLAIKGFTENITGGLIALIEGYFKAIALDCAGIESVAFTGISVYRIDPGLREYLLRRRPDRIFIMYDADAFNISYSNLRPPECEVSKGEAVPKGQQLSYRCEAPTTKRSQDFAASAQRITAALFSLFASVDHKCEIVFVTGNPDTEQKGVDDLIHAHGAEAVATDLTKFNFSPRFQSSEFFSGFTLARSTFRRKLQRLFLGKNYRHWFENLPRAHRASMPSLSSGPPQDAAQRARSTVRQKESGAKFLKAKRLPPESGEAASKESNAFLYRNAFYQALSHGDLYDNTVTYNLITNPFAVDLPTDQLTIKKYLGEQKHQLHQLINRHDRLAIQAPTGSGKTTFLAKYAKRNKQYMVIAMPTVVLAKQTARSAGGYALTGERDPARIKAANDHLLVFCTYDTLPQIPDQWRRVLVVDEAHNLINQYGQVYNGTNLFRADVLRRLVELFPDFQKTILLSGTMPPLLCYAFDFHLVTFQRLENPNVRVFDIEADSSTPEALSKCLITRLAEVFPARAQRVSTSPLSSGPPKAAAKPLGAGESSLPAERQKGRSPSNSGNTAPKQLVSGKLHVVFWNNTNQINRLTRTLTKLNYLDPEEIAVVSRTHYDAGDSPDLDDIIRKQQINPRIKLLICTCLISEGVNIKNSNIGHIYTIGLRCEDTFRQFIARFRKLKTVNVFSILEAERDLQPEFFRSAKLDLLENLERAKMQATHLQRRRDVYQLDYEEAELPYLDQIERYNQASYGNGVLPSYRSGGYTPHLLNLTYYVASWSADPLHVLAAIHGRKLATGNNCFFYTRLRSFGFRVLRIRQEAVNELVNQTINAQQKATKELRDTFRESLIERLLSHPAEIINALYLYYHQKGNRHGTQHLRALVPDLLDDNAGETGARYLAEHRRHFDAHTTDRIFRFAKLHKLGVQDKAHYLLLSKADFNHEYQATRFHFEQLVANDPELRKQMLPAHKEEVRIKQRIVAHLTNETSGLVSPTQRSDRGAAGEPQREASQQARRTAKQKIPLTGEALLKKLHPLLAIARPTSLSFPERPPWQKTNPEAPTQFLLLDLTPARTVNLVRRILHTSVTGHGRYRTITIEAPFSKTNPPPLAARAANLLRNPVEILQLLST